MEPVGNPVTQDLNYMTRKVFMPNPQQFLKGRDLPIQSTWRSEWGRYMYHHKGYDPGKELCQRNGGPREMLVHIKVVEQDFNLFAREIATWLLA